METSAPLNLDPVFDECRPLTTSTKTTSFKGESLDGVTESFCPTVKTIWDPVVEDLFPVTEQELEALMDERMIEDQFPILVEMFRQEAQDEGYEGSHQLEEAEDRAYCELRATQLAKNQAQEDRLREVLQMQNPFQTKATRSSDTLSLLGTTIQPTPSNSFPLLAQPTFAISQSEALQALDTYKVLLFNT